MIDVLIIGAGPAGSTAAAFLLQQGFKELVLEKQVFPRYSIGESMLPASMAFIEKAGMMEAVMAAGFQYKDGAAFLHNGQYHHFNFAQRSEEHTSELQSLIPISYADFCLRKKQMRTHAL